MTNSLNNFIQSDGSSFCGLISALLLINQNSRLENYIDIFRIVKDLRDMRPYMVRSLVS